MTEAKVESKDDSDSEEQNKGADASPAVSSQPQRIALFPGVDPSSLKVSFNLICTHLGFGHSIYFPNHYKEVIATGYRAP